MLFECSINVLLYGTSPSKMPSCLRSHVRIKRRTSKEDMSKAPCQTYWCTTSLTALASYISSTLKEPKNTVPTMIGRRIMIISTNSDSRRSSAILLLPLLSFPSLVRSSCPLWPCGTAQAVRTLQLLLGQYCLSKTSRGRHRI
jgi:hypothetical protein